MLIFWKFNMSVWNQRYIMCRWWIWEHNVQPISVSIHSMALRRSGSIVAVFDGVVFNVCACVSFSSCTHTQTHSRWIGGCLYLDGWVSVCICVCVGGWVFWWWSDVFVCRFRECATGRYRRYFIQQTMLYLHSVWIQEAKQRKAQHVLISFVRNQIQRKIYLNWFGRWFGWKPNCWLRHCLPFSLFKQNVQ